MGKRGQRKALREGVEPLLTVTEACAVLNVGITTFYRWLSDPSLKLRDVALILPGGRMRFPANRLRAWVESL